MKQHTPIIPPNSALARPQKERRPSVRVAVFVVLAFHLVLLVGLLIQGCKHSEPTDDTLARIAKAHGTTVRAIHAINRLKSDQIVVGQKLTLPETGTATVSGSRNSSSQP